MAGGCSSFPVKLPGKHGNPHGYCRNVRHQHQDHEHRDPKGPQLAGDAFNGYFPDGTAHKERRSNRWRDQSDRQVQHHDDAEMNRINPERADDRQHDRRTDQEQRCHIHNGPQDKQHNVDQRQNHILVV